MKTKKQIIDKFISENNLHNTAFVITNGSEKMFSEQEIRDAIDKSLEEYQKMSKAMMVGFVKEYRHGFESGLRTLDFQIKKRLGLK